MLIIERLIYFFNSIQILAFIINMPQTYQLTKAYFQNTASLYQRHHSYARNIAWCCSFDRRHDLTQHLLCSQLTVFKYVTSIYCIVPATQSLLSECISFETLILFDDKLQSVNDRHGDSIHFCVLYVCRAPTALETLSGSQTTARLVTKSSIDLN